MFNTSINGSPDVSQLAWKDLTHDEQQSLLDLQPDAAAAVSTLIAHAHAHSAVPHHDAAAHVDPLLDELVELINNFTDPATDPFANRLAAAGEAINVAAFLIGGFDSCEWEHHDLLVIMKSLYSKAAA